MTTEMIRALRLDHLVLTVRDVRATCSFYERALGMTAEERPSGRWQLRFGDQLVKLQSADTFLDPDARHATPGSADLCFIIHESLNEAMAHLRSMGVPIAIGPVRRSGARGAIMSIYVYDPDENLIEISNEIEAA